jgi:hypothetical protein
VTSQVPSGSAATRVGERSSMDMVQSAFSRKKPRLCPSGEKKGQKLSSGISKSSNESSPRRYSADPEDRFTLNAT